MTAKPDETAPVEPDDDPAPPTAIEAEIARRQSLGRQLYAVLVSHAVDEENPRSG